MKFRNFVHIDLNNYGANLPINHISSSLGTLLLT